MHKPTGNIMRLTEKQAQKLNDEWSQVKFVKNEKGERVMRFTFDTPDGTVATVDVQAIDAKKEVAPNGQPDAS